MLGRRPATASGGYGRALAAIHKPADTSGLATYATLAEVPSSWIDIVVETVTEDLGVEAEAVRRDGEASSAPTCRSTSNSSKFRSARSARVSMPRPLADLALLTPAHLIPRSRSCAGPPLTPTWHVAEKVGAIMTALGKWPVQVKK